MIHVFKGLKLRVAAAIISAILLYGILTFVISAPIQPLAVKTLRKAPTVPCTTATKTVTATTAPKPHAEIGAETYKGFVDKEHVFEYETLVQNLLISVSIALMVMAIFRMRMR